MHDPLNKNCALSLVIPNGFRWKNLAISMNKSYYDTDKGNIDSVISTLAGAKPKLNFDAILIPAIRQIGSSETKLSDQSDFSGSGIIERLQKLERPVIGSNQEDKKSLQR